MTMNKNKEKLHRQIFVIRDLRANDMVPDLRFYFKTNLK
jgi:hypothetical protein